MSDPTTPASESGISIYISAQDMDDARALFEKAMDLAATGRKLEGELVFDEARQPSGCAQLFTHLRGVH